MMATDNAAAEVIQAQAADPPSGITVVAKYTEKIKVACKVGTGELAQSYSAHANVLLFVGVIFSCAMSITLSCHIGPVPLALIHKNKYSDVRMMMEHWPSSKVVNVDEKHHGKSR